MAARSCAHFAAGAICIGKLFVISRSRPRGCARKEMARFLKNPATRGSIHAVGRSNTVVQPQSAAALVFSRGRAVIQSHAANGRNHPELIFAMTRAIGTDSDPVVAEITSLLDDARYQVAPLQLSSRLKGIGFLSPTLKESPENERYRTYMNAGDLLRSATERPDAVAVLGIEGIREKRGSFLEGAAEGRGRAYILKSLMHPSEVDTLRRVYGSQLFVISTFAPRDIRVRRLARVIGESRGQAPEQWFPDAERLVNRDFGMPGVGDDVVRAIPAKYVIDVQKTFKKADLYISATAPDESSDAVRRFMELIFGHPFHTPNREEFGMCMAYTAAMRSSSLGRGVGAAVLTESGDVVSIGTNEVPKFGGGEYWAGDRPDGRTFVAGYDSSDRIRRQMFADLIRRLHADRVWANGHAQQEDIDALNRVLNNLDLEETITKALSSDTIGKATLLDVIEYGREVHAEMAALTDAAKRGVPVRGCVLYCTTFPCHECARLIVSAGISRVVYIEPYPKSRVAELYEDSIGLGDRRTDLGSRVRFEPFVGISPRRYFDLFSWVPRKAADVKGGVQDFRGDTVKWSIGNASLRDSVADRESLESGARAQAIDCGELQNLHAFQLRLQQTEEAMRRLEQSSEIQGAPLAAKRSL
jgi:deoxycytidylate deaminase